MALCSIAERALCRKDSETLNVAAVQQVHTWLGSLMSFEARGVVVSKARQHRKGAL